MQKVRNGRRERMLFGFIMLLVLITVLCVTIQVNASQSHERSIQVKSILIESGDTLWDIAAENYTEEYNSMEEYVNAIKDCNHISSDTICAGSYLIIPFYQ